MSSRRTFVFTPFLAFIGSGRPGLGKHSRTSGRCGVPEPPTAPVSGTGEGPICEWVKNVRTQRQAYVVNGRRRKARFEEVIQINPLPRRAGEGDTARRLGGVEA